MAAAAQVLVADLGDGSDPVIDDATAHHLGRVLRLRPGEVVCASDGAGGWCLTTWGRDGHLEPTGAAGHEPRDEPAVSVGFVPAKGDRPELVVQKLTELGVDRIVVTTSARSVVRWDGERAQRNLQRLRRVAAEASGQCRRLWLPELDTAPIGSMLGSGWVLADMGGVAPGPDLGDLLIGPEGGWSDGERAMAQGPAVSLGRHVLRAETAAIAAGVLLTTLRGAAR